jgi:hypothetical protein
LSVCHAGRHAHGNEGFRTRESLKSGAKPCKSTSARERLPWLLDGKVDGKPCGLNIKPSDFMGLMPPSGSAGRIRTYDQPINSRLLYH